jgi:hypothetical protein
VIGNQGCQNLTDVVLDDNYKCPASRGNLFNQTQTSFKKGTYGINNIEVLRKYGVRDQAITLWLDFITFGYFSPSSSISSVSFLIPVVASNDWDFSWLGFIGLDGGPTNLSDIGGQMNPRSSLLDVLKDAHYIPSKSWGYTAGSFNRKSLLNIYKLVGIANKRRWIG